MTVVDQPTRDRASSPRRADLRRLRRRVGVGGAALVGGLFGLTVVVVHGHSGSAVDHTPPTADTRHATPSR